MSSARPQIAPRRWILGELAIVLAFLTMPLPRSIGIVALAILALATVVGYMRDTTKLLEPLPMLCIVLTLWLTLGLIGSNVVSTEAGLLGLRLSLTFVVGAMLGYIWPDSRIPPFRTSWYSLAIFSALSIVVHLYFPQIETAISRGHDEYTALFAGQPRLQGLWPSPAHASLAAVFLILSSARASDVVHPRALRWFGLVVGVYALYLTQIRVGILACIAGLIFIAITSGSLTARVSRLLVLTVAALGIVLAFSGSAWLYVERYPALASLFEADSDSRLLGRLDTWKTGLDMLVSSPVVGWGPGSAGSTLGEQYPAGGHVTPHSPYLKYAVEGGVPALLLFLGIMSVLIIAVIRKGDDARMGVAVLAPLLITSVTGTVVEAIPVSLVFAVILGRYAGRARGGPTGLVEASHQQIDSRGVPVATRAREQRSSRSAGSIRG